MTGTIPEGWKAVEMGSLIKVLGGFAFKSADFAEHGSPVIRISNLSGNSVDITDCARIPLDKLGKGCRFKLEPGDTLIAMSGATTGKLGYVPDDLSDDWYLNQRVGAFRIGSDSAVDRGYFRLLLNSDSYQTHVWNLAAGAAQPNISGKQLESAVIPLPPLAEQKRIAAILDAADALRAKRRESLGQLDTLLQSTFLDMFGDPVTNPNIQTAVMAELVSKFIDYRGKSPEKSDKGIPLITAKIVKDKEVKTPNEFIPENDYNSWMRRGIPASGDVIITTEAPMGEVALVPSYKAAYAQRLLVLQPNRSRIEPIYLMWALTMPFVTRQLQQRSTGSTVTGIRSKEFKQVQLPTPPLDLQRRFSTIVESVEQQKARLRDHLAELDTLFASLQQRAFNGDL